MHKLIRITTVPLSLEKLLEGQLTFMNNYFEVTAISAEKERLEKFGNENGVNTFWVEMTRSITPFLDLKAVFKLYKYLKAEKPLIVHTHTPKAGIVGMMAAKMAGVPIRLHTVAGLPLLEATGSKRRILIEVEKWTYRFATRVYPNSRGLLKIILENHFTSLEKLKILGKGSSNGINTNDFDPGKFTFKDKEDHRAQLGISNSDFVFLFIGRLVSDKGINELVSAFISLNNEYPWTSLLLVGPLEEDLDPLEPITTKNIESHPKIFTTGYQVDVRPYLAISDVLAFPSYREGFPNVVMQAGAMNLPSIVTDINGCNEIVQNEKNGLLVPVRDKNALLQAMKRMIEDKGMKKRMKEVARDTIVQNYDRQELWQALLQEYQLLEESEMLKKDNIR